MADLKYRISAEDNFSGVTSKAEKAFQGVKNSASNLSSGLKGVESSTSEASSGLQGLSGITGISSGAIGKLALGIGGAVVAFKALQMGVSLAVTALRFLFDQIVSGIPAFASAEKSMVSLSIISKRFGEDAFAAMGQAKALSHELGINLTASANGLQTLLKSGLNLEMASDLMRRFTNEAITGKRENISLSDAVANLTDMYYMELSALGNMSGIGENMNVIMERGSNILDTYNGVVNESAGITPILAQKIDEAKKHFEEKGQAVDGSNKELAKYVGMIALTNETLGSSDALMDTYVGKQTRLNSSLEFLQIALGGVGATFLSSSGAMETATGIVQGVTGAIETLAPIVHGIAVILGEELNTQVMNVQSGMQSLTGALGGNQEAVKNASGVIVGIGIVAIRAFSYAIQIGIGMVEGIVRAINWYSDNMKTVARNTGQGAQAIVNAFVGVRNGIANAQAAITNTIIVGFETAVNFAVRGINSLATKANSVIGTLNQIPGVNLGSLGQVGEVSFGRVSASTFGGGVEAPNIAGIVESSINWQTGVTQIDMMKDKINQLGSSVQGLGSDFKGLDFSFLDKINESGGVAGAGGAGGSGTDKALKEKEREIAEKLKLEQDLADKIRIMKAEQIEDEMEREIELQKIKAEIEMRELIKRMEEAKISEDQKNAYILASREKLEYDIFQIQEKYRIAAEAKAKAEEEKREKEREAKAEERKRKREERKREEERRQQELARLQDQLEQQELEALEDGKAKEESIAKWRAEKEIEEFNKSIASKDMKAKYEAAREAELQAELQRIRDQYADKEPKKEVYSTVQIDKIIESMNFNNSSNPQDFLAAIQKLFSSELERYIKGA